MKLFALLCLIDEFYLIYFDTDDTVLVVKKLAVVEQCLEVSDYCQVNVQKKLFKGRVVSYGQGN